MEIKTFQFNNAGRQAVESLPKGKDWPVVYIIHNNKNVYIGETTSASGRMAQHLANSEKRGLKTISIVFDDTFNKSVILDFEQKLIKYCKADTRFRNILNRNAGQSSSHNYYDRLRYEYEFNDLWPELIEKKIAKDDIITIQNRDMFKFSPYTALTEEQTEVSAEIINDICDKFEKAEKGTALVNGCAGTGKTVLAINIINSLVNAVLLDEDEITEDDVSRKVQALVRLKKLIKQRNKQFKIGFVFPMTSIRNDISKVFNKCGNGLNASMVIGPTDLKNNEYDILLVDEAHRLCAYRNIANYGSYKKTSAALGLDYSNDNQLDWILKQSKYRILFYDSDQSIKGSDITPEEFEDSLSKAGDDIHKYALKSQMRCEGGSAYIDYVKNIFDTAVLEKKEIVNYDFQLFDDVDVMVNRIKKLNANLGLCRNVAGYSWEWTTKEIKGSIDQLKKAGKYDIEIDGHKYIWNRKLEGWILREDAIDTIGCIHTVQGFDLNYVGIILGKEIDYDYLKNRIIVDKSKFKDTNVKNSMSDDKIHRFIINTYTTMFARGIKGCYVYAYNENLRKYLKRYINTFEE